MKTIAPTLLLLLLASTGFAQELEQLPSTGIADHFRLTNRDDARLDIDVPRAQAPSAGFPTILVIPGLECQAEDYSELRVLLVRQGYATATFEWKDNEDYDADDWDEQVEDVTELLLAADQGAGALAGRIDEARLGVVGHSLGGSVAVLAAARDGRFKALALFGPGGKQDDFLDRARDLELATIAIDGSLDRVTPPDEASGVVLERANTPYKAHVIITDGSHPNAPADYDADFIRDAGRYVWKPVPFFPFWVQAYEFPIIEGITPITGPAQRAIAFPYLVGWFDRFVAGRQADPEGLANGQRAAAELAAGKLTRARYSPATTAQPRAGIVGALGGN